MTLTSVSKYSAVIDGNYVHYSRMTAEQEEAWRSELARQAKQRPAKTTKQRPVTAGRGPSNYNSRRTNYAEQVIGRSMAELVDRVNQAQSPAPAIADDIPFDGMAPDSPAEITGADWYGVA